MTISATAGSRHDAACLRQHRRVHEPSVHRDRGAVRYGFAYAQRPRQLLRRRPKPVIDGLDLCRMHAQLGAKAKRPRAPHFIFEDRRIVEGGAHAVDGRDQSRQARMKQDLAPIVIQRLAGFICREVEHEIDRAKHHALYARRPRQRGDMLEAHGRFHQEVQGPEGMALRHARDRSRILGLRYHDAVEFERGAGGEIIVIPVAATAVDAHEHFHLARAGFAKQARQGRGKGGARRFLARRLDGIFQVDDHRAGAGLGCLYKALRTRGRRKKIGTNRFRHRGLRFRCAMTQMTPDARSASISAAHRPSTSRKISSLWPPSSAPSHSSDPGVSESFGITLGTATSPARESITRMFSRAWYCSSSKISATLYSRL